MLSCFQDCILYLLHRRRIDTDAKAKVVASVWGAEFIQFLAAQACLLQSIWKNRLNFILFCQIDGGQIASVARN